MAVREDFYFIVNLSEWVVIWACRIFLGTKPAGKNKGKPVLLERRVNWF